MNEEKSIIRVVNLKKLKDGSIQFTVVLRTSLGLWYERGWRLMKTGSVQAPSIRYGFKAWKICKPPTLARRAIRKKLLRKLVSLKEETNDTISSSSNTGSSVDV